MKPRTGVIYDAIKGATLKLIHGGTSKHALCRRIGISTDELSSFLSGKRTIRLTTADKLAEILHLEVVQTAEPGKVPEPRLGRPRKAG